MNSPEDLRSGAVRQLMEGRDVEESFRRVFHQYHHAVHSFFSRKGFSPEDCRDLTQEVFVAVHTGIETLRSEDAFVAWLFSIARHMSFRHMERRPKVSWAGAGPSDAGESESSAIDRVAAPEPDALSSMIEHEKASAMREAIEELPVRVQDCLRCRLVDGLNYREIGERLGISENTVAVHVHRGVKSLRKRLRLLFGDASFTGEA